MDLENEKNIEAAETAAEGNELVPVEENSTLPETLNDKDDKPTENPEKAPEAPKQDKQGPDKKKLIIIAAAAVAVIAVLVIIISSSLKKKDISEPVNDTEKTVETLTAAPTPTSLPTPTPEITAEPTVTPTPSPTPTEAPKPVIHTDEVQSALTGEWISKDIAVKRPYCVMLNNIEFANPQSGIGCADILYEALTEGGITRLMGVFEGLTEDSSCKDRIGSVRSARHYFASFADEYDAIFIHYGETTYATKKIDTLKLDHLEGTYGIGTTVFYRDKSIKAPHNAFASLSGIWAGIEKLKLRTDHNEDWNQNHFKFVDKDLVEAIEEYKDENPEELIVAISADEGYTGSGSAYCSINGRSTSEASLIQLNYSKYMSPYLTYDENTKLYTRHQYDDVHIDYNTNTPLTFKNIIIQIVHEFDKDKNGYQDMELHNATGKGYYITEGLCIPITWTKNENKRTMNYYTEDGELLTLNNGKTFISVYPDFRVDKLVIE